MSFAAIEKLCFSALLTLKVQISLICFVGARTTTTTIGTRL
jgi:hypothetical protein